MLPSSTDDSAGSTTATLTLGFLRFRTVATPRDEAAIAYNGVYAEVAIMQYGLLLLAAAVVAQAAEMKPFEMVWRPGDGVLADLSFLHDKPAGKRGFVHIHNSHLARGDGQRLRFWGVNFSFTASLPAKQFAGAVADHLARFGVNCVRIHHLDWRAPRGIIDSTRDDSRGLDPVALDRLDLLIAQLKRRGIYTNLNLNVARAFQPGDGVKDAAQLGYAKGVTYFDPRIIELQKEYAKSLLTHRNPYTGNEYRNEPAIAMVEMVNENSLVESWVRGRLQGKGKPAAGDATWSDIPASYERDLTALFHAWLAKQGKPPVARLTPSEFKTMGKERFDIEARFYMELEDRFFQDMYRYLKSELGVKMPVVGTSIHAGGLSPYPLLSSTSKLDIVDAHTYWQHPAYLSDSNGRRIGFEIRNTPAVNEPSRLPFVTLTRAAVKDKPFMVSEVNHPYPNEFAAEGIPMLAAYGAFQDWDAVFWYSFEHSAAELWDKPKLPGHFDMRQDPLKMTQWAAPALTFLRGDVQPAERIIERSYSADEVRSSLLLPSQHQPFFTPGLPEALPLLHGTRVSSLTASKPTAPVEHTSSPPYITDTRQIAWRPLPNGRGLVTVDTDRTQSVIGWLRDTPEGTRSLSLKMTNDFGATTLVSMSNDPIAKGSRLLLVVGTKTANRDMEWNAKRTSTTDGGTPGMMIEAPEGTVILRGIDAKSVRATPLDGGGRPLSKPAALTRTTSGWELLLSSAVTPWYLIEVAR